MVLSSIPTDVVPTDEERCRAALAGCRIPAGTGRDSIEVAIRHPSAFAAQGWGREQLLVRQSDAELALAATDWALADLLQQRRELADRIRACRIALVGTGRICDLHTGALIQKLRPRSPIPYDEPVPQGVLVVLTGEPLRRAVVEALGLAGAPLTLREIDHVLVLLGRRAGGQPGKTISDALRVAQRDGRVRRASRGRYTLGPSPDDDPPAGARRD